VLPKKAKHGQVFDLVPFPISVEGTGSTLQWMGTSKRMIPRREKLVPQAMRTL
jgi:hypothetical protein